MTPLQGNHWQAKKRDDSMIIIRDRIWKLDEIRSIDQKKALNPQIDMKSCALLRITQYSFFPQDLVVRLVSSYLIDKAPDSNSIPTGRGFLFTSLRLYGLVFVSRYRCFEAPLLIGHLGECFFRVPK